METKIKVAIVDDHEIFRKGLKLLINKIDFITVISESSNGKELLDSLDSNLPDIIFMDIRMPEKDGIETTEEVLKNYPNIKIIALSTFSDKEYFKRMLEAGADGYLLKNTNTEEIKKAITKILNGGNHYSYELLEDFAKNVVLEEKNQNHSPELPELSKREIEVLELICKGYSNIKIGEILHISNRTVEQHKSNLLQKTNSTNTVNLVIYAFKNKLIEL